MIEKVRRFVDRYHMIEPNDRIVAGVSGGADSVCLLLILEELRKWIPFSIYVVHVNHKMREEAGADAAYVKNLCDNYKVPYYLIEEDVEAISKKEHLSSEEAGRKVRYDAFERILIEQNASKIAVAHNKNDRAETVLFHLFRGSSIKGMNGIAPVREQIIRPLLCVERSEIETYLAKRKILYCVDRTNAEDIYTRNRIRNHILPYAEEQICENVIAHINDTAETLEEAEALLQKLTKMSYDDLVQEEQGELRIERSGFQQLDRILQKCLIMDCMHRAAGSRKDITSRHVQQVLDLFDMSVNKKINLPYHMIARTGYENIVLSCVRTNHKNPQRNCMEAYEIKAGQTLAIPGMGRIETKVFPYQKSEVIPEKTYTKWFDYDKIGESMLLRHRHTGDYFVINQNGNRKTLKEYMIHEKIPQEKRDELFTLAVDNHIIWLIGYRISQHYKVDQNTKNILAVHIVGGNSYERAR